jgi:hypothetical protein
MERARFDPFATLPGRSGYRGNGQERTRKLIDELFNGEGHARRRKVGFVLMVFPFGEGPCRANYISNAAPADVVALLKEQLARFEGQADQKGRT